MKRVRKDRARDTWLVVVIVAVAVLVLLLLAMFTVGPWGSKRRTEARRREAGELRGQAQQQFAQAGQHEATAEEAADRARRAREEAMERMAERRGSSRYRPEAVEMAARAADLGFRYGPVL
jgi:ABC-type transport system involved in cytochrome bd biosynthesis fused ATPase/permease subunit